MTEKDEKRRKIVRRLGPHTVPRSMGAEEIMAQWKRDAIAKMADARKLTKLIRDEVFNYGYDASPIGGDSDEADFAIRPSEGQTYLVSVRLIKPEDEDEQ